MFQSETPLDINVMSDEEICELVKKLSSKQDGIKVSSKLARLKNMYKALGYTLSNDIALSVLVNTKFQLILAPAGGCKTTTSQIKLIFTKLLWNYWYAHPLTSDECLCLVYNHENRLQMEKVHDSLLAKLQLAGVVSSNPSSKSFVNPGIKTHTLHSFCLMWLQEYASDIGWSKFSLLHDNQGIMQSAVSAVIDSVPMSGKIYADVESLLSLYEMLHSLMLPYNAVLKENALLSQHIEKTQMPVLLLTECFSYYDKLKRFYRKYDFTDLLIKMSWLLDKPDVKERFSNLYSCFIVDEVQDFTPLMLNILSKLIPLDKRLVAIGDDDQSLYSFRGATSGNMMNLKNIFPELRVYQMFYNRRCGSNILAAAKRVIELNKDRYEKALVSSRAGGEITKVLYDDSSDMIKKLLRNLSKDDKTAVICSRERSHGMPVTFELYRHGIQFHTLNSACFLSHIKLTSFMQVLNLLYKPVRDNWLNFYKICSLSKQEWMKFIDYDSDLNVVRGFPEVSNLFQVDFSQFESRSNFMLRLGVLKSVSNMLRSTACSKWFKAVFDIFEMDYWKPLESYGSVTRDSELADDWINQLFNVDDILPNVLDRVSEARDTFNRNQKYNTGVAVATMHALKGLEYDEVHILNLADSTFPNYRNSSPEESDIESENRLMYVAMTRAKDNLYLYVSESDPSYYDAVIYDKLQSQSNAFTFTSKYVINE